MQDGVSDQKSWRLETAERRRGILHALLDESIMESYA